MNAPKKLVIATGLSLAIESLVAGVVASTFWPASAAALGLPGSESGGHCERLHAHRPESVRAQIAHVLKLSDVQQQALTPVLEVLDVWRGDLAAACNTLDLSTAAAGLAMLEQALAISAIAAGELRPAFDGFYASLSDAQRARVDGWLTERHHGHGHGRWARHAHP